MTWIRTIPQDQANADLRAVYDAIYLLYPPEYGDPVPAVVKPDGTSDGVTAAHSLIPEAMRHMMSGLGVLLQPGLPLTRSQHELIAAVVSATNACFY